MKKSFSLGASLVKYNPYIIFSVLLIVCIFSSANFLLPINLINIGLQQAAPLLVAVGMLFVILTGGIDLSVGAVMAVAAAVVCRLMRDHGAGLAEGLVVAVLIGVICGFITGILIAYCNMAAFVASLSVMTSLRGVAYIVTNGTPIKVEGDTLLAIVSRKNAYPIIWVAIGVLILFFLIQRYTTFGRIVVAIGSNKVAVELAGIRVKRYILATYIISGMLAAVAGIFFSARVSSGAATTGTGSELNAVAACVLGGASLSGGRGYVLNTLLGALTLAFIGNIMNLLSVGAYIQEVMKGILIIVAVLLQGIKTR